MKAEFFLKVFLLAFFSTSSLHGQTAVQRIAGHSYFDLKIVQIGGQASEQEAQLLWEQLNSAAASNYTGSLTNLEQFLEANPTSSYAPSLDAALGAHYVRCGRWTLALEHLQLAWEATKNYASGDGKKVADFALVTWAKLLASLGRVEVLTALMEENKNRVLDRGPLSQSWMRMREATVDMQKHPEHSYQCGTFALNSIASSLNLTYNKRVLMVTPSPTNGFSMKVLSDLSQSLGLGLVPVVRESTEQIPVPAVVHWQQGHYGAIVEKRGDRYKVIDPTFGYPRWMNVSTINDEASGAFMILANQVNTNYRLMTETEAAATFGRGNPNFMGDGHDGHCDDPSCPPNCPPGTGGPSGTGGTGGPNISPGGCGRCSGSTDGTSPQTSSPSGMPRWSVSEPYLNLWLDDEPMAYRPAFGQPILFSLSFKQRKETVPHYISTSSVGFNWDCPWLSFVTANFDIPEGAGVHAYRGGTDTYYEGGSVGTLVSTNYFDNNRVEVSADGSGLVTNVTLNFSSGAKEIYAHFRTNEFGFVNFSRYYLTQKVSPEGYTTRFIYEAYDSEIDRLKYVVDPDGQTNTISYVSSGYSDLLINQVDDPYGRHVYLSYDSNSGMLTNITDAAGISSWLQYDGSGWVTNLVNQVIGVLNAVGENSKSLTTALVLIKVVPKLMRSSTRKIGKTGMVQTFVKT